MSAALISSGLEAKVEAVNLANSEALWLQRTLKPVFANYLGKQVVKKDGSLLAKVASELGIVIPGRLWCRRSPCPEFFPSSSRYSVQYTVKSCVSHGGHSYYHEVPVYIGHLGHNGEGIGAQRTHLEKLADDLELRTDWTAEEVERNRRECREAEEAYRLAQHRIVPFGYYD